MERFYGQPLVTAAVKDLVEELEPGVHQFFPMELYVGKEYQRTDYFFNIAQRLDTLHKTKTYPLNSRGMWSGPSKGEPFAIVFDKDKIAGHHAWRDKYLPGGAALVSNELCARLQDAGITGLFFKHYDES